MKHEALKKLNERGHFEIETELDSGYFTSFFQLKWL